jgi:hypothetical protein
VHCLSFSFFPSCLIFCFFFSKCPTGRKAEQAISESRYSTTSESRPPRSHYLLPDSPPRHRLLVRSRYPPPLTRVLTIFCTPTLSSFLSSTKLAAAQLELQASETHLAAKERQFKLVIKQCTALRDGFDGFGAHIRAFVEHSQK